jgi:transposase
VKMESSSFVSSRDYVSYSSLMPWTGDDIAGQREQFVVRATSRNQPFKEVCAFFGISRTTGYKWVSRYEDLGNLRDLKERSRRPHQVPNKTAPDIERKVLALRDSVGWGARKLAAVLRQQNIRLAASTVHHILRRNKRIGTENSNWATWMIQVLLADDPLPQLQREFPNAIELSRLSHFISTGRLPERKKAMAVVASLKRIPVMATAKCLQIRPRAVTRYFNRYGLGGTTELFRCRRAIGKKDDEQDRQFLFSVLHTPPSAYGINRTSWKMDDLHRILTDTGHRMSHERIRRMIKAAGFRWRKAKVVLTSTDPDYRAKLDEIEKILSNLKEDEAFFSIDEYGPFAIKRKGGRKRVGPGEKYVVPQWQKSKGWTIITAALELSTNQVTHFYSLKKNTEEMIKMTDLLREQYWARRTIYLSWDAASWHISKNLASYLKSINQRAVGDCRPIAETAPLPACSQFLNVIESVFSGMARAIIHNSDYASLAEAKQAIDCYFKERNEHFRKFPKRAGGKIWGLERVPSEFSEGHNCKDPRY